ncbi:MAG: ABC transporter ATP-binding protein [Myxococcales bacterium]|nr:MAG: ABC transporter ATP-binding protein [Myxococcales bacterium]
MQQLLSQGGPLGASLSRLLPRGIQHFLPELRPYRATLAGGAVLLLATNALEKSVPWLLRYAIDAFRVGSFAKVKSYALGVVICAILMGVVRVLSRVRLFNVGRDIEWDLRNRFLIHLHQLGSTFFRGLGTGQIMSRATSDIGQVRFMSGFGLLHVINALFAYGGAMGLMLTISPKLSLLSLIPYPFFVFFARSFSKHIYLRSTVYQQRLGQLSDIAQESFSAIRVVRAFANEEAELKRFERINQQALEANMALVTLRALMWPVLMAVSSLGVLISLWVGGQMVIAKELSIGEFVAFNAYLGQLVWPTLAFGYVLSVWQRGQASYERVQQVLASKPEVYGGQTQQVKPITGELKVRGLRHAYDKLQAVCGIDFDLHRGQMIAIVGRTGSGKSTVAALLARLLPLEARQVFIDGHDVTDLPLRQVRQCIGYTQQEAFLFSSTIAKNIGFALDDVESTESKQAIAQAASAAGLSKDIESFADGLETVVGERGVQLSGGQKQRVALARALLLKTPVMVLDDPLSAVDAQTEAHILENLRGAVSDRSLLLITNRIAAASIADTIYVMDKGKIIESGNHHDLISQGGLYAELHALQQTQPTEDLS